MTTGVAPATATRDTADGLPVPKWLWLHLPIALLVVLHVAASAAPLFYEEIVIREDALLAHHPLHSGRLHRPRRGHA